VGVELPGIAVVTAVVDEVLYELVVEALGGLPGEAEDVEAAAAGLGLGWGGAVCCPPVMGVS
jgi:hypothetical protein